MNSCQGRLEIALFVFAGGNIAWQNLRPDHAIGYRL